MNTPPPTDAGSGHWHSSGGTILVVDDDPDITSLLEIYFADEGYTVLKAHSAGEMWDVLRTSEVSLILLDINLPDGDGFSLTQSLRNQTNTPVIIVSRKNAAVDQVVGLELGADDYVTKPFDPRNLLARIRSVLRRSAQTVPQAPSAPRQEMVFGTWRFDPTTYRLIAQSGEETILSANESALLQHMVQNPGSVMSRDDLMVAIKGRNWEYMDRSIDILIARLRKKIEPSPVRPTIIKTVRGAGYVFAPDAN